MKTRIPELRDVTFLKVDPRSKSAIGLVLKKNIMDTTSDTPPYFIVAQGRVYGHTVSKDGDLIATSAIAEVTDDNVVITNSGSHYKLESRDPFYEEFEKACSDGVPVLTNWAIGTLSDDSFYIRANISDSPKDTISKKVVSQKGPMVTFFDNTTAFVDWTAPDACQMNALSGLGLALGAVKVLRTLLGDTYVELDLLGTDWGTLATAPPYTMELARLMKVC